MTPLDPEVVGQANEDPPTPLQQRDVAEYLDETITHWRQILAEGSDARMREIAPYYVDAFQSVRSSLLGETLPLPEPTKGQS